MFPIGTAQDKPISYFPFWTATFFRQTLLLDIILSQINNLKPILFCLNYVELFPQNVLKFKYTLKQIFPLKWSLDRSVYSHEMRYFIDELGGEVTSVCNLINACCLTKQSRNLVATIKNIIWNVIVVLFPSIRIRKTRYAVQFWMCFDQDILFMITAC